VNCGRQSPAVRGELSALGSLKRSWHSYKATRSANVPFAAFSVILGIVPIAALVGLIIGFGHIQLGSPILSLLLNLIVKTIAITLFLPFVLIGFDPACGNPGYAVSRSQLGTALRSYPKYLWFSLMNGLYFILIYVVCFGLPSFASDPILRLVWVVLVNYWLALVLPVPILMERKGIGFLSALRLSYRHFHVVRWNLYLLALVLTLFNLIAFALALIPLVVSLPFAWFAVRDYTDLLLGFEIIRDQA
jgi:hypothetical protein